MGKNSVRLGAVLAAAAIVMGGAGSADATADQVTSGAAGAVGSAPTSPVTAGGFRVVRELTGEPLAALAPAKAELWLASREAGAVRLEHLLWGRWTSTTVSEQAAGPVALTGSARTDVWLSVGDTLRRYDGSRWTQVRLPKVDTDGAALQIDTIESPRAGVVYVSLSSAAWEYSSRVFRYAYGHWAALGAPSAVGEQSVVTSIRVVDGAVLTRSWAHRHEAYASYRNGTWSPLYDLWFWGTMDSGVVGGWYPRTATDHLLLGGRGTLGMAPGCWRWTGSQPLVDCAATKLPSASAQFADGSIVLAESDYYLSAGEEPGSEGELVQGGFALRGAQGGEVALAGDPGDRALMVVADRTTKAAAWAITQVNGDAGPKTYLQRYVG